MLHFSVFPLPQEIYQHKLKEIKLSLIARKNHPVLSQSSEWAKEAIARPVGQRHHDPQIAVMEEELEEAINSMERGPMGLGGRITTLGVHIETAYTHITQNPIAINTQCWPARRSRATISPEGQVEYGY